MLLQSNAPTSSVPIQLPSDDTIAQRVSAIRSSWSSDEKQARRIECEKRQERLLNLLGDMVDEAYFKRQVEFVA
jgi:hypothetical protein